MSMAESQLPRIGEPGVIGRLPLEIDRDEELYSHSDFREEPPEPEEERLIFFRIRRIY